MRSNHLFSSLLLLVPVLFLSPAAYGTGQGGGSHLLAPVELRCDSYAEPLAVASAAPHFSWSLEASSAALHGVAQSVYQIQVKMDDRRAVAGGSLPALLWDSTPVAKAASANIEYGGAPLEPGRAYAWRVRVWDEGNRASAWSAWAHWSQAPRWNAQWIKAPGAESVSTTDAMPLFRRSFALPSPVARARLYISGVGQDEVHINGRKAGLDELAPGWSDYRKSVYYESYDVTSLLHAGDNAIGILLGNGMYRVLKTEGRYTKFVASMGPLQCIAQLKVELADGKTMEIVSDGQWKTAPGPIVFSSTYGGEDYDARREPAGWDRAGFDDSGWEQAAPSDGPGGKLMPELAPPLRRIRSYLPVRVTTPRPGVLVYDLGQNFAGWPRIAVAGPAGATVKLIPGELLNPDGTVSQASSGGPQWFSYTLKGGGRELWHPRFSYYGFRYVQVEGASRAAAPGKARMLALAGEAIHTSSQPAGSFASSETLLNRIHTLILRAIENNAVSLFTDCPHREKLGWLEETHLMEPSMLYDFDLAGLYAATAHNIADTQTAGGAKAGMVPEIAPRYVLFEPPNGGVFDDSPEWGSAAVIAPWLSFERSGDRQALAAQLDVMRRYVAYLGTRAKDGIIAYGLGDWYDIGPGAPGFSKLTTAGVTATAIYYQDLRILAEATRLLGYAEESERYAQLASEERDRFNARFLDKAAHRYDRGSQTAQAMPLELGMVPEEERDAVMKVLVDDIRAHNNHVTAGDIGYHYVVDALLDGGRSDVLLDMLGRTDTPSYGYQLAQGATALTEAWDANPASSQDHFMLGHAEEWFYRGLAGIALNQSRTDAPPITLKPYVPAKVAWSRASYRCNLGWIRSSWRREGSTILYEFTVPVGTEASVELPAAGGTVTANGLPAAKADGVLSAETSGAILHLRLASGLYRIRTGSGDAE